MNEIMTDIVFCQWRHAAIDYASHNNYSDDLIYVFRQCTLNSPSICKNATGTYRHALARQASHDGYIVLALVDAAFVDMAINLYLTSLRPNGIDNFLFVGVGRRVCDDHELVDIVKAAALSSLHRRRGRQQGQCLPQLWLHPKDEHSHGYDRRSSGCRLHCCAHWPRRRLLPQSFAASQGSASFSLNLVWILCITVRR